MNTSAHDQQSDDSADAALRSWAAGRRAAVHPPPIPVERFVAARIRSHRGVLAIAAAVIAVVAIAVTLRLALPTGTAVRPATGSDVTSGLALRSPAVAAQAGMRSYVFHGLAVDVPAGWPLNAERCGTPIRDTLAIDTGAIQACALGRSPRVTSVQFSLAGAMPLRAGAGGRAIRLGTLAALRRDTSDGHLHTAEIVVPSLYAEVTITSPSRARVDRVAAALHPAPADSNGCPAHTGKLRLDQPGSSTGRPLVPHPASVRRVVVCGYDFDYVEGSQTLSAAAARTLIDVIDAAPAGLSRTPPSTYLASRTCLSAGAKPVGKNVDKGDDARAYVIHVEYVDHSETLVARLAFCGLLGVSNGHDTAQRTDALVKALMAVAGASAVYPGTVRTAR